MKKNVKKLAGLCLAFGLTLGFATAGALTLTSASALEITGQPTGDTPIVSVDAENATYQWYRMNKTLAFVLDDTTAEPFADGTLGAMISTDGNVTEEDGVWSATRGFVSFIMALKENDVVTFTPSFSKEEAGQSIGYPGLADTVAQGAWQYDEVTNTYTYTSDADRDSAHFSCNSAVSNFTLEMTVTREVDGESVTYPVVNAFGKENNGARYVMADHAFDSLMSDSVAIPLKAGELFWVENSSETFSFAENSDIILIGENGAYARSDAVLLMVTQEEIEYQSGIYTLDRSLLEGETEAELKNIEIGTMYVCEVSDGTDTKTTDIIACEHTIFSQPTAEDLTFDIAYGDRLTYQWYEYARKDLRVVHEDPQSEEEIAINHHYDGTYSDGLWTDTVDVIIEIAKGEKLIIKPLEGFTGTVRDYYNNYTLTEENGVYTWTNEEENKVDFNLYVEGNNVGVEVFLEKFEKIRELEGETGATLQNPEYGKTYVCEATEKADTGKMYESKNVRIIPAIVSQPTLQLPTVEVNYPNEVTGYQWYTYKEVPFRVVETDAQKDEVVAKYIWDGYYEDGCWKTTGSRINIEVYVDAGCKLTVIPSADVAQVREYYSDEETFESDNGVYTYVNNSNERRVVDLLIEGVDDGVTVEVFVDGGSLELIPDATYAMLPLCTADEYVCVVSFSDGEICTSDVLTITEDDIVHNWNDGEVTTQPTHTEFGVKTYTCACGETKTEEVEKSPDHSYGDWTITKEATATEKGSKSKTCVCGDTITEEIPATGASADSTPDNTTNSAASGEKSEEDEGGCGSSIAVSSIGMLTLIGGCLVLRKKKES